MNKIAKTINIYLVAVLPRLDTESIFKYIPYIEDRKIKIINNTPFIDAYLQPEYTDIDITDNLTRKVSINLSANIELHGTENEDFHVMVDELGQIVITLDVNLEDTDSYGEFVEVTENKDVDLVIENIENTPETETTGNENSDNEPDAESVTAEVLTEAELSDEEGPQWIIQYDLGSTNESLTEDEEPVSNNIDTITAPDIETAVKYAEQNARIKAKEDDRWLTAEIIQIKKQ